jgi:hypothetical protein
MDPLKASAPLISTEYIQEIPVFGEFPIYIPPSINYYKTGRKIAFNEQEINALQIVCPVINTTIKDWRSKKVFIAKVLPKKEDYADAELPSNRIAQILSARYSNIEVSGAQAARPAAQGSRVISAIPSDAELVIVLGDSGEEREPGSLVAYIPADNNLLKARKFACFLVNDLLTDRSIVFYVQIMPVYPDALDKESPLTVFKERSGTDQVMVFLDISRFTEEQVDVDNTANAIYRAIQRYYGVPDTTPTRGAALSFTATSAEPAPEEAIPAESGQAPSEPAAPAGEEEPGSLQPSLRQAGATG